MKVMTVLGTRPEIIRLSRVIVSLDSCAEHTLIHTGQNFDHRLNELFFEELGVRAPDHHLGAQGSFGDQAGTILSSMERLIRAIRPDRFLVLGDTNSGLSAVAAKRLGVPVFHMEAGNRCYDDRVPEEINRRIIDHSSDVLLPYTERSRQNLIREGIAGNRIFVTGNPIFEVLQHYDTRIHASRILTTLGLATKGYFLVTLHRAENVDEEARLRAFLNAFDLLNRDHGLPVIVSTHPRTRQRLQALEGATSNTGIRFLEPFGFFDFITLEREAFCVLSDSGTVQEECSIFGVPNITLRDATERPETLECGSNVLSGADPDRIQALVKVVTREQAWVPPTEYLKANVAGTVIRILTGHL